MCRSHTAPAYRSIKGFNRIIFFFEHSCDDDVTGKKKYITMRLLTRSNSPLNTAVSWIRIKQQVHKNISNFERLKIYYGNEKQPR